jgi:hypothetical protein
LQDGEKIYLHTDRNTYFAGETIWIRAYLLNTNIKSQVPLSSYVYVELLGDVLIKRIKIKDSEEGFSGQIKIPDNLPSGKYTLRSYTDYMQNFPAEYIFSKEIKIVTPSYLRNDLESKSLPENETYFDVQFFPESGRYFSGKPSRIAFKAIGRDGLSVEVSGTLYKPDGRPLAKISTRHKGMGILSIENPDSTGYYAMLKPEGGRSSRFDLPKPEKQGASVSTQKRGDTLYVTTHLVNESGCSLNLTDGVNIYLHTPLMNPDTIIGYPLQSLPSGVNSVKVMKADSLILAERLFYIHNSSAPGLEAKLSKATYSVRDSVAVSFFVDSIAGFPVKGNFSVSVTDSAMVEDNPDCENIKSYMTLSSALKGYVEDAGYYFRNVTSESESKLDLLMMTQGWRYYYIDKPLFEKEQTQILSGSVSGLFTKEAKNTTLMIYSPSIHLIKAFNLGNLSHFKIEGLDFKDSTSFLLGISGKNGGQLFGLTIDSTKIPSFRKPVIRGKSFVYDSTLNTKGDMLPDMSEKGVIHRTLKEIYVKGEYKNMIVPKYNPSPFTQSYSRNQIRERKELTEFDNMDIIDYLAMTFPGLTVDRDNQNNRRLISTRQTLLTGATEPLLYVDRIRWDSTNLLDMLGMKVLFAENIIFLRGNEGAMYGTLNGVILITRSLRNGIDSFKGISNYDMRNRVNSNIKKIYPTGYQTKIKFYSPKYSTPAQLSSTEKDMRRTLYWNPCVKSDFTGKGFFSFYTDDKLFPLNVRIEGLLLDGTPVVKDFKINRALKLP